MGYNCSLVMDGYGPLRMARAGLSAALSTGILNAACRHFLRYRFSLKKPTMRWFT